MLPVARVLVIQAAADAGKLAIGVDSNQNGMAPGSVDLDAEACRSPPMKPSWM